MTRIFLRIARYVKRWVTGQDWRRILIALGLFGIAFGILVAAQRSQGVARDEVTYMHHGSRYASWWSDMLSFKKGVTSEKAITAHFGGKPATAGNREHPPLMKTLFGFSERIFHRWFGVDVITAYRLPTAMMAALLVALLFTFVSGRWGYPEGLAAAALIFLLPRHFFHSGLAAFDSAIVTMWMATLYAYYKALRSWKWCVVFGVIYGLTLATKHNAVMLPVVIGVHYAWVACWGTRQSWPGWRRAPRWFGRALWGVQPLILPAMLLVGPLVLIMVWPWMWFDTASHLGDWMRFHLKHVHYNFEYLGNNWNAAPYPWHVPIVTTVLTVPVVTLVAGCIGAGALIHRARRKEASDPERAPALLLFLSAGVSMGPFILRTTPIFGAEKHWAPAMVTVAAYAGIGLVAAVRLAVRGAVERGWLVETRRKLATVVVGSILAVVVIGAAAIETASAHPYALSHYNALAGGAPGGADLGMNRQFWGYSAHGILPFLNERAPAPGQPPLRVYSHDASPAWSVYHRAGRLSTRVVDSGREQVGVARSQLAIVVHELHFNRHDYMIWRAYGTVQPVFVLTTDGVPIVSVYARTQ